MRRLALIFCGLILSAVLSAQSSIDVVKCKDGKEYRGRITEKTDTYVRIGFADSSNRIVYNEDILSISSEEGSLENTAAIAESTVTFKDPVAKEEKPAKQPRKEHTPMNLGERGYFGKVDFVCSVLPIDFTPVGVGIVNGYRINEHLAIGLGVEFGVTYMDFDYYKKLKNSYYIPIYGQIRYDILNRKVTPYISADLGYNFAPLSNANHSHSYRAFLMRPELGIAFNVDQYRMLIGVKSMFLKKGEIFCSSWVDLGVSFEF